MKYYLKTIFPLVAIAVFFSAMLGVSYYFLEPIITETQRREEQDALRMVLKEASEFSAVTNDAGFYYEALDSEGGILGYIFREVTIGYGGEVVTLVGITLEGTAEAIFVLNADKETPGLGYKITERAWQNQFSEISPDRIPLSKAQFDSYGFEAITGATISSVAVTKSIAQAFDRFDLIVSEDNDGGNDE
jgi:electron transport complex protein RnfG